MIRPIQDNVLLVLEPDIPKQTAGGIYTVPLQEKSLAYANRTGIVLAVGPGHYQPRKYRGDIGEPIEGSALQPTSVRPGERVIVAANAGDRYAYTKRQDFADMYGGELDRRGIARDSAEFRMIREAEILAVIDSEVREGAAAAE